MFGFHGRGIIQMRIVNTGVKIGMKIIALN